MPPGRLPREVFQACPTRRRPRGRPRTRWRDYVSQLAWERLRVPQVEELEEVSGEGTDLDGYTSSVLSYLKFCTDAVLPTKTIKVFPNQKPWLDSTVKPLLKAL
ncbi:hypothetical protein L3Q82_003423 [Scortum barcoo]|uniref:Uncharacterized protein n=1 Tax=Scortum barcoo TaxID=214431 RepID=A0ACB8VM50_9TELE|nr:hypothetical protein L3Q82_003423 [Scortum barcoo]